MTDFSKLPYRLNVGAVLFNKHGQILVARRANLPNAEGAAGGWQLPQGGIDADENPAEAIFRELTEEIGTANAEIIGEHPDWLDYDLPPELLGVSFKGC
jgi:putative (di)nucleoside polyphosphate hydrolase